MGREGEWYWAFSLSPVEEFGRASNQPNEGTGANCMYLNPGGAYLEYDGLCSALKYPISHFSPMNHNDVIEIKT